MAGMARIRRQRNPAGGPSGTPEGEAIRRASLQFSVHLLRDCRCVSSVVALHRHTESRTVSSTTTRQGREYYNRNSEIQNRGVRVYPKYKQYAINIKQQLQINSHSTHFN